MNPYMNLLNTLASQARKGDAAAATRLRRELEPKVVIMVRQTLQPGGAKTPLDQRIRAEARRAGLGSVSPGNRERETLIAKVAEDVCRSWMAEFGSPARCGVAQADTVALRDVRSLPLAS